MRQLTVIAVVAFALVSTGCTTSTISNDEQSAPVSPTSEGPVFTPSIEPVLDYSLLRDTPTSGCRDAMAEASGLLEEHYAKYDSSSGSIDWDAEMDDYNAIIDPLYDACDGPHDLMAGFKKFPSVAGVTGPQWVDNITLDTFCYFDPNSRSCVGYVEALPLYVPK